LVAPELKENEIISDKEVILKWSFASDEAWKLMGFDVLRAEKPIGPYAVIKDKLKADVRSFRYNDMRSINYFKIRAYGIGGDYKDSSPNMIQPIDSIPPVKPVNLTGAIDTLGIVRLQWDKNTELDLKGYAVLRANRPNQEFTRIHKYEFLENMYQDTVSLKNFNENVYYKLVALDNRYNESLPSEILELKKPSKIPPANPTFKTYEIKGDTIQLKWTKSVSEDISKYIIYRKQVANPANTLWENIFETTGNKILEYKDINTIPNTKYRYTVVAVNESNLESKPSPPISIITVGKLVKPVIKGLTSLVDREKRFIQLNWRYIESDIEEVQLFRKVDNESEYSLYKTFKTEIKQFIDIKLEPNSIYTYGLKVVFNDGSIGKWEELKVKY